MVVHFFVVSAKHPERSDDLIRVARSREPAWMYEQMVRRSLDENGFFALAYDETIPVGYTSFFIENTTTKKKRLKETGIYVIPSHRGKKISPLLAHFVRKYAEQKGITIVHSPRTNMRATRVFVDAAHQYSSSQKIQTGVNVHIIRKGDDLNHVVTRLPRRRRRAR